MLVPRPADRQLSGAGATGIASGDDRIVVIGAGGWLGLATLELLSGALGGAFPHRVIAFGSNDRMLKLRDGLVVRQFALERLAEIPATPTLAIHLAFLTKDRAEAMAAHQYIAANHAITCKVLGALDKIGAQAIFVPSSGAAYSVDDEAANEATRLYGQLKRDDEATFSRWASKSGARAVIARVFNLSGPYINKQGAYALSAFILDALAERPIGIRATRPVYRSYVAIRELMSVVFGLMVDGTGAVTLFDTAGDRNYEMAEIAEAVRVALGRPDLPIERPALETDLPDVYAGDGSLYAELRRQFGVSAVDFSTQVHETAAFISQPV